MKKIYLLGLMLLTWLTPAAIGQITISDTLVTAGTEATDNGFLRFTVKIQTQYPEHRSSVETITLNRGLLDYDYSYRGSATDDYYHQKSDKTSAVPLSGEVVDYLSQLVLNAGFLEESQSQGSRGYTYVPEQPADEWDDTWMFADYSPEVSELLREDLEDAAKSLKKRITVRVKLHGKNYRKTFEVSPETAASEDYMQTALFFHQVRDLLGVGASHKGRALSQ